MKLQALGSSLAFAALSAASAEPPDTTEVLMQDVGVRQEQQSSSLIDLQISNAQASVRGQLERLNRPLQRPQISVFGVKVRASSESAKVDALLDNLQINYGTREYKVPETFEYCGYRVTELSAGGARNDGLLQGNKYGRSYAYAVQPLDDQRLQVKVATIGSTHLGQGRAWVELLVELLVVPKNTSEVHRKIMGCTWPDTPRNKQVCVCQVTPPDVVRANCWDQPTDFKACAAAWTKDYSRCIAPEDSCSNSCTSFERPQTVKSDLCYRPDVWQPDDACKSHLKTRREAREPLLALLKSFPKAQRSCIQFNKRSGDCAATYSTLENSRPGVWSRVKELTDKMAEANASIAKHEAVTKKACGDFN